MLFINLQKHILKAISVITEKNRIGLLLSIKISFQIKTWNHAKFNWLPHFFSFFSPPISFFCSFFLSFPFPLFYTLTDLKSLLR